MNNRIILLTAALVLGLSSRQAAWGQEADPVTNPVTTALTVSTDREWYLAGEPMNIVVTADDALIAYAELCDTYRLAAGVVVGLKNGTGAVTIELPADLHSGYYALSVYTRHRAEVSRRLVAVVNPLRRSADDDIEWVKDEESLSQVYSPSSFLAPRFSKTIDMRETEGHIIRARVGNTRDGHAFRAAQIRPSLAIIGKQIHYFEGKMEDDSTAVFFTYGIRGRQPLVLSAATTSGESLPITMVSPFAGLLPDSLPHLVFHYDRSEVEARSLDMQRHQLAIAPAKRELQIGDHSDETAVDAEPLPYDESLFGTHPDLSYNLDEYRQFFTVREVLIEYVSCVSNTKERGVPQLSVRTELTPTDSSWPTLVLIDGMPVFDVERLLNYDARRVHFINIYGGQYTFGGSLYNGVLSFVTRSGRLTNYPTEPNAQYLVYDFPF